MLKYIKSVNFVAFNLSGKITEANEALKIWTSGFWYVLYISSLDILEFSLNFQTICLLNFLLHALFHVQKLDKECDFRIEVYSLLR
jgi:hypothetical protein